MIKTDIILPINYSHEDITSAVCSRLPISPTEIIECELIKRTLSLSDKSNIHYTATAAISLSDERESGLLKIRNKVSGYEPPLLELPTARFSTRPVIIGAGPSGLFCALALAEAGARPIIYERGLDVGRRDARVKLFSTLGVLDPECNIQFGEGGAGTYSDGKLKVGSQDKYKTFILREFVDQGANCDIMFSTGAHLGTDKLSDFVQGIRRKIESLGGEVHFGARLTDVRLSNGTVVGGSVVIDGTISDFDTDILIFATGHSARDSFELLRKIGAPLERRGFGIGMRLEHPREYIDRLIYGDNPPSGLGAASYHLVTHLPTGRSVYSFCMCPGGTVVPAASEQGGIVTNGMSVSNRDGDNSNAAILVSVTPEDFGSDDIFAGLDLQRQIERRAYALTDSYRAPNISLDSFMSGSTPTPSTEVIPTYPIGTCVASPERYLPEYITESMRAGIADFDAWLPGYYFGGATLTGPETRTTSPIKVVRDDVTGEVLGIRGLYAIGEGAGYAGGIISSARDGVIIAETILKSK